MPSLVEILQNTWLVLFKWVKVTMNTEELSWSGDLKRYDTYCNMGSSGRRSEVYEA